MPVPSEIRIVCLHGLGRSGHDWDGVRTGLEDLGAVVAPDLPRDPGPALALARAEARGGAVLVGHSLGGVLALRLAGEPAASPAALVLTGCFFPPARNGRGVAASVTDFARHRRALVASMLREGRAGGGRRGTGSALRSMVALATHPARSRALLDAVRCPVLVLHARDDHHVPVDFAAAAAACRARWSVEVFDRGGHHLHTTRRADWLAVVRPWLAG